MKKLETMTAEQLQSAPYSPEPFLVEELLPEGLHILAGAPKIGKSWLALWLCLCVAQGQPLWNFAVTQGEVLYLSLEDSYRRIQSRLFDLTDDAPQTLHFAIMADTLKHGLEQQIEQFLMEHPTTKLVVIDTLQRVRGTGSDSNLYANDYQDIGILKQLADRRHIAILLIHHLRKLHDDDPMNMISGSTGLSGAADSTFVLQKSSRLANIASLHCTGRDIPDRTLKLEFGEDDHVWKLLENSKTCSGASKISTLQLVHLFSELLRADPEYLGSPSALSAKIDPDGSLGITPKKVTRLVRESVAALNENGILADTYRSNGKRWISIKRADSADFPPVKTIGTIDPVGVPSACTAP
ncbi:MAG: AAA family ATPase [Oscillospiraceae bacterium]